MGDTSKADPLARNQGVVKKGLHRCKPLIYLARPAGFEPTNIPLEISSGNCKAQLVISVLLEHRPDYPYQLTP